MLLVEMTVNSVLKRISQEGVALSHWWDNQIISFVPPQYKMDADHGGFCKMDFGEIVLSPEFFENDWPPPVSCPITAKYTASTEAAAETLFTGNAHRKRINREEIAYDIFGESYDTEVASGQAFNDTLVNVITWACDATRLNLTVDSTAARSTSPTVQHTMTADRLLIDVISDFAAFYSHLFYISGGTLYLVDMLDDNGTRTVDEFNYFPSEYVDTVPVAEVTNNDHSSFSAYPYGRQVFQEAYHGTAANVEAAFDDIITVLNKARASLAIPFAGDLPAPGEKISWTDTAQAVDLSAYIRARTIAFDFDNEKITIDGEGAISAA